MTKTARTAGTHIKDASHIIVSEDVEPKTPSGQDIAEAVARLQRAVSMGSGASPSAQRVLDFCFKGRDRDTIALIDLCRLDTDNQDAAKLLIDLVATVRHSLPNELLNR
jgi:hypothetical protein